MFPRAFNLYDIKKEKSCVSTTWNNIHAIEWNEIIQYVIVSLNLRLRIDILCRNIICRWK